MGFPAADALVRGRFLPVWQAEASEPFAADFLAQDFIKADVLQKTAAAAAAAAAGCQNMSGTAFQG
jgi:hypothetical protein